MNINELNAIKERALKVIGPREANHNIKDIQERTVLVCGGTGCTSGKSALIFKQFKEFVAENGLTGKVHVIMTGCFGLCALGPVVIVYPEGAFYSQVKPEYVAEIASEHLLGGKIVTKYLYKETVQEDGVIKALNETAFYK
ncbi:MAG: (2Fe-2S) ferredoxin domain-containing protein, partial [Clostridia bacterium]|nr:(2Fe-2S) ferredoxin domain-containing protein [Clostridia bacterium]